jgi:hypothetical protein
MITRRQFSARTAALAMLTIAPSFLLTACGAQSYISIIISAVSSILGFIGGPLAGQIAEALAAVQTAVANWKTGTITQQVTEALQALQAVLDTVPLGKAVDTLIGIAIAAIEAILGASGGTVVAARVQVVKAHPAPATAPKTHKQFAHSWNAAVEAAALPASIKVSEPLI